MFVLNNGIFINNLLFKIKYAVIVVNKSLMKMISVLHVVLNLINISLP
jgi:hypothetical protein